MTHAPLDSNQPLRETALRYGPQDAIVAEPRQTPAIVNVTTQLCCLSPQVNQTILPQSCHSHNYGSTPRHEVTVHTVRLATCRVNHTSFLQKRDMSTTPSPPPNRVAGIASWHCDRSGLPSPSSSAVRYGERGMSRADSWHRRFVANHQTTPHQICQPLTPYRFACFHTSIMRTPKSHANHGGFPARRTPRIPDPRPRRPFRRRRSARVRDSMLVKHCERVFGFRTCVWWHNRFIIGICHARQVGAWGGVPPCVILYIRR